MRFNTEARVIKKKKISAPGVEANSFFFQIRIDEKNGY